MNLLLGEPPSRGLLYQVFRLALHGDPEKVYAGASYAEGYARALRKVLRKPHWGLGACAEARGLFSV